MELKKLLCSFTILLLLCALPLNAVSRTKYDPNDSKIRPDQAAVTLPYCVASHNVGKLVLAVNNYGSFGDGFAIGSSTDCFTSTRAPSCEYPKGSGTYYLFAGAFWIGAVVGRDTLVSAGADGWYTFQELHPYESPFGDMIYRSIIDPAKPEFEGAISEQDYIAVYTDTFTTGVTGLANDEIDGRPHQPLYIEVTQRTFAWSYPYAEDFILFDYAIKNIGVEKLNKVYMGIYVDADVKRDGAQEGFDDDICGFLETFTNPYGNCEFDDTVFIAWIADNDGELEGGGLLSTPVPNITATRIVRTPSDELDVSFNWWVSNGNSSLDFGPRKKTDDFRDLGHGGLGTPSGDRNKYAFMRNQEFDYDQIYTANIGPNDPIWLYPNQTIAQDISNGYDTRYLLSFGPFNIDPGQSLPISFAYVGGENLHSTSYPENCEDNLEDNYHPGVYYENLNFDDLSLNSMWASWVYDNPGVDSDDDKNFGKFRECCEDSTPKDTMDTFYNPSDPLVIDSIVPRDSAYWTWNYLVCDTFWYKGDNVPDFRGASPPPAPASWSSTKDKYGNPVQVPAMRVYPSVGQLHVRWNGLLSETTRDVFSREHDFEGYRVYASRDDREGSFVLLASYDIEDYNRYDYNTLQGEWELNEMPFTLEELRCLYGDTVNGSPCNDTLFDPTSFTRGNPLNVWGEDGQIYTFYFEPQDFNRSILANYPEANTPLRKVYPDQPYPSSLTPDSADTSELTEDGFLKYFEYEYTIENLLPTVLYYVNVTAFDFGSPQSDLGALETSKTNLATVAYPLNSSEEVEEKNLEVYVYPNPYRINSNYIADGFEGRDADYYIPDRMRRLHFANLPAKCTIRIYTLDGDLIREIEHNKSADDPTSMHEEWDLITRNTQRIVTGIYYWVVEDADGNTQIGKFVVIM
ncbi:MAG: hypothetical protein ACOYVF_04165 [Candidatus Zixiibacteriota bacterium]